MSDELFQLGISNAVNTCMNVQDGDRVVIITDKNAQKIGLALADESAKADSEVILFILEDYGNRPMTSMPEEIMEGLIDFLPTVALFTASGQEGERIIRNDLIKKIGEEFRDKGIPYPRYANMTGITEQQIRQGMTADYKEVHRLTYRILDLVKDAKQIETTSIRGTEVTASFNPDYSWIPCHGLYHEQGSMGNLPEGEVFTCPANLNGKLVVDVLGEHFSSKYGVLNNPLSIQVRDGLVTDASCQDQALADEFQEYLDSAENGRRAGEFAIGTNPAVKNLVGSILQDEKMTGIHVAFGDPYPKDTGADWSSPIHVDVIPIGCTILVDGEMIMDNGEFTID